MKFISLSPSTKPTKKLMITFSEPNKTIHFGSKHSETYLDHKDTTKRTNYLKRHQYNENWDNPLTAGALSAFLLWGPTTDLKKNLKYFLHIFNIEN